MPFTLDWFIQNIARQQPQQRSQNLLGPNAIRQNLAIQPYLRQSGAPASSLGNAPPNLVRNFAMMPPAERAAQGQSPIYTDQGQGFAPTAQRGLRTGVRNAPVVRQQGSGRPPRVPGPRNPMGRQRIPQVPQESQPSARINRMNWIDFFQRGGV